MKKHWTPLCLFLRSKLRWNPEEIIELVRIRKEIINRWKNRNESLKLFKQSQLTYSPGYYSLKKEE